jgi:hypothetical protein
MFELALFHVTRPDRERDLHEDIRSRQLLRVLTEAPIRAAAPRSSAVPRKAVRVQATER